MSLEQMASKGAGKLAAKAGTMKASYVAALSRAKTNYGAMPFGPNRKAAYNLGVDRGQANYRAPDPEKWRRNWEAIPLRTTLSGQIDAGVSSHILAQFSTA